MRLRKILAVLLTFMFILGNAAFAAGAPSISVKSIDAQKPQLSKELSLEKFGLSPNQEVRVVVEVDGKAPIEVATEKGVKFGDLPKNEQLKLQNEATQAREKVKRELTNKKLNADILHEFTTVMNGFSANVKFKDIEKLKSIKGVKNVYISKRYEIPETTPDMLNSKEMVQAQQAWRDYGNKGEGMVIGIIDSGIDPNHKDMVLTDSSTAKLDEATVNSLIEELGLPGKYYSEKVPYGYNYADNNQNIIDRNPETDAHGMHVAGISAANGDEENGGIKGVAPEAQLLALRVFPEVGRYTYADIYVRAIDDAIALGADVLNMSLGSPAGFVAPEDSEQQAIKRAFENGIIVSVSAGNSSMFGDGFFYPYASNPDYGVVGSPGVSYYSLQVASAENTYIVAEDAEYAIDGEGGNLAFLSASQAQPQVGETYELVYAGLGYPEDFEGKDLEGKYALIQRGELAFVDKTLNAQAAGAAGVFIYNNEDGVVNMASDPAIVIPQLFMLKSVGDQLAEALNNGQTVTVTFTGEKSSLPNPEAGLLSSFSSWGLTPNLDFKPEIMAPGGQIYSTLNDNEYGMASGTSMAAPHVAGGAALVLERVDDEFGLEGFDRAMLAKNLMMNTASPIEFDGAPLSPRAQGAGLMQLHSALSTPVIVTNAETGEAKVPLKEVKENVVTFELVAENFSDEDVTYVVTANAQTDTPVNAGTYLVVAPKLFGSIDLGDVVTVNGSSSSEVTIPAGGTATIEVSVDVSGWDSALKTYFTNGYWLEGFVRFVDPNDVHPDLVVPYVGFKGEWDDAPIFDDPMWDPMTYYEMTGLVTYMDDEPYWFGMNPETGEVDPNKLAISPNGDGVLDNVVPIVSFIRNAKEVTVSIVHPSGRTIEELGTYEYVPKNLYDNGRYAPYYILEEVMWEGKRRNLPVPEGQYYLKLEAVIDYEGAAPQSMMLPFKVDITKPQINGALGDDRQTLTLNITDNLSGVVAYNVLVDGIVVAEGYNPDGTLEIDLGAPLIPGQKLSVVAEDYAGNLVEKIILLERTRSLPALNTFQGLR